MYFSLQHLSLSDATVLKFFVPFLTGLSGAIFLKEPYMFTEMLAGRKDSLGPFCRACYLTSVSMQLLWSYFNC
jgi:hypothetical protein